MENKKSRKKVLFFTAAGVGGAERMTINIAKMLPTDEFEVKFVVVGRNLGDIVNFIPKEYEVSLISILNIYCFATLRIMWKIFVEKPDIVFCSLYYINARLIVAAKLLGTKVIVRSNSGLTNSKKSVIQLVKMTYSKADRIICQQEEMRQETLSVINISEDKVVTLQNPIDVDRIKESLKEPSPYTDADSQTIYVNVSRFNEMKAQDTLVKAFKGVKEKRPDAHLYLVGLYNENAPYDAAVIKYIKDNNLEDCIHLVGMQNNPYKWVKNANCYVLPSRTEGLPNSLIEAMYIGIPAVATRCIPIIERIVNDGKNGYLAEVDNVESIETAMLKAVELRNFENTYKPASKEDFIKLFREVAN
ncbi:MAG: glycosyltransferase [Bacteroidales bacterium]|nr:glycosyltransferase [Bacteroidales bacterium]